MKILHIIYTLGISGAEKHLKHLLPGLLDYGIEPHLIVVCTKETRHLLTEFIDNFNAQNVPALLIDSSKSKFVMAARQIDQYCRANKINIIHSHLSNSDLIAVLVKKLFNPRIILVSTKHGYDENVLKIYEPGKTQRSKTFYYYATKFLQNNINKNIAVSKGIADLYYDFKLNKDKIPVVYHGISIPAFKADDFEKDCRKSKNQIIIVGRIEQMKGHHFLVRAMKLVVKEFPDSKLLVLGTGSAQNQLESLIHELDLDQNIELLGFKAHPYSYISNSDVIIMPSNFEAFGLVYIEAFASKVPVIAFDAPAGNEIIEDGKTGLLVPKGDVNMLTEKIIYLLKNKEIRELIAENAYNEFLKKFTTKTMVKNTAAWYLETFAKTPTTAQ